MSYSHFVPANALYDSNFYFFCNNEELASTMLSLHYIDRDLTITYVSYLLSHKVLLSATIASIPYKIFN